MKQDNTDHRCSQGGGGKIMLWGCFSANAIQQLPRTEDAMHGPHTKKSWMRTTVLANNGFSTKSCFAWGYFTQWCKNHKCITFIYVFLGFCLIFVRFCPLK